MHNSNDNNTEDNVHGAAIMLQQSIWCI